MDHALQTISYIADIGSVLVLMARRRLAQRPAPQARGHRRYKMLCHVFHSEDVSSPALGVLGGGGLGPAPPFQRPPGHTVTAVSFLRSLALSAVSLPDPKAPGPSHKPWRLAANPRTFPLQACRPPLPSPPPIDSSRQWLVSTVPEATGHHVVSWESCPPVGVGGLGPKGLGALRRCVGHPPERCCPSARRPSSSLRPSARPSPWPTASSFGKAVSTPTRWAPSRARAPRALATSTMGTSTTSPTARTAGR